MNSLTSHAISMVVGGAIVAGVCAYNKFVPHVSSLAPPAPEIAKETPKKLECKPILVYRDKVEKKLNLPDTVKRDPDKHVVASSNVPPSDYPHTMTAVYDEGTGGVDMFLRQDPLPWLSFNRRGSLGVAYGWTDDGSDTRVYGKLDLLQIKRLHAGLIGDVNESGRWYGGGFVETRW